MATDLKFGKFGIFGSLIVFGGVIFHDLKNSFQFLGQALVKVVRELHGAVLTGTLTPSG